MKTETQIREEIEGLHSLTTAQLKEKYREVFGEQSRPNHKQFLFRRIAWRIQANAWGGLSERARRRALEIADDADLRIRAPKNPDGGFECSGKIYTSLSRAVSVQATWKSQAGRNYSAFYRNRREPGISNMTL
ncbi:MAG: DUF2924 domain-containing protein [Bryobacterales bacterium]|nr:DUF2924 domain-containing protein [Bryobacterales bacterium]